jgi:hypothetical protein
MLGFSGGAPKRWLWDGIVGKEESFKIGVFHLYFAL